MRNAPLFLNVVHARRQVHQVRLAAYRLAAVGDARWYLEQPRRVMVAQEDLLQLPARRLSRRAGRTAPL